MKQSKYTRKVLTTIAIALKTGVPIAALVFANVSCRNEVCKVIEIDEMSLFLRLNTTPGIVYPPPWKIHVSKYRVTQGDTWVSISKRYGNIDPDNHLDSLEILLRVNGVSEEETHDILCKIKMPESIPLHLGQIIYVPVDAERKAWR